MPLLWAMCIARRSSCRQLGGGGSNGKKYIYILQLKASNSVSVLTLPPLI